MTIIIITLLQFEGPFYDSGNQCSFDSLILDDDKDGGGDRQLEAVPDKFSELSISIDEPVLDSNANGSSSQSTLHPYLPNALHLMENNNDDDDDDNNGYAVMNENTIRTSSSSEIEERLWEHEHCETLEKDEEGKIEAYVDFNEFNRALEHRDGNANSTKNQ